MLNWSTVKHYLLVFLSIDYRKLKVNRLCRDWDLETGSHKLPLFFLQYIENTAMPDHAKSQLRKCKLHFFSVTTHIRSKSVYPFLIFKCHCNMVSAPSAFIFRHILNSCIYSINYPTSSLWVQLALFFKFSLTRQQWKSLGYLSTSM